jgi:hypothetical protein
MIAFLRNNAVKLVLGGALALAATSGFFASVALGLGTATGPPTVTTTISVGAGPTGETGPAGPPGETGPTGPVGPAGGGADDCPTGSSFEAVELNHPGGHVTVWVCVAS